MAFRWRAYDGQPLNGVLVAVIFQGIRTYIAIKTLYFCDFSGGGPDPLPPLDTHMELSIYKLKLGRVGIGRVSHLGPSWHGPSFIWAELVGAELVLVRVVLHPFSSHPLRFLWVNVYKGNGISGRDHCIFCSSVMLGTACTA